MFHVASRGSSGLFQRAISHSGPILNMAPLHLSQKASHYGREFALAIGCATGNSSVVLACMQSKPLEDIMKATKIFERFTFMPNPWKPTIDTFSSNPVFHEEPRIIFEKGGHNQVRKRDAYLIRVSTQMLLKQ